MFKRLYVYLAGAMMTCMLVGCGDNNTDTIADNTQQTAPEAESGASATEEPDDDIPEPEPAEVTDAAPLTLDEVVTINLTRCTFNLWETDPEQVQKVEDAINAYIDGKINVQINLTDLGSGEYFDEVAESLADNDVNLFWTADWAYTIGTDDLVSGNDVYDITDLLPRTRLYNVMDERQWEASKYNGSNFFIPIYSDNADGYDILVRKELADKYGWDLSSVKTIADIKPFLADCKAEGLKYPYLTQSTALFSSYYIDRFDFFTDDAASNWVAVDRDTDTVVETILTEEYREFCALMADWAENGYISVDDDDGDTSSIMRTQNWGFSWWADVPTNDEASGRYRQEIEVIPVTSRWVRSYSGIHSCYAIAANSTPEQALACIEFLWLLNTDSALADLYTYGIEGEDYYYEANGQVNYTDTNKYSHSMWESASALAVTPTINFPDNAVELYKAFNDGADLSCAAGFHFDTAPVEEQFKACRDIFGMYGFPLENGGVPAADVEAAIDAYYAALIEAGYQDIIDEFTSQYNSWK